MTFRFRDLSIRTKLMTLLVMVVVVALLLSTAAGLAVQYRTATSAMERHVTSLAEVLCDQSRAGLQFRDQETAEDVLRPLARDAMIVLARTYDAGGNVFATYQAAEQVPGAVSAPKSIPQTEGEFFDRNSLHVFRKVTADGQTLGYVYLRASLAELNRSLRNTVWLAAAVFGVCLGVALLLGHGMQRVISGPLRRLAEVSAKVTAEHNYSMRVEKPGEDELGTLIDAFNTMLKEIQARDAKLERSSQQFQAAVEWAPTAMVMIDSAGTIILINAEVVRMFGYARDHLLGQKVEALMPERFRQGHRKLRDDFFNTPSARQMSSDRDLFGRRKDGSEFPIEIGLGLVESAQGDFVLAAITDVTQRKEAEAAIRRANEELEQRVQQRTYDLELRTAALAGANDALQRSNNELENFAYISSHDLQEPLRKIRAFGDLLVTNCRNKLGEEGEDYIDRMQKAAERMQTLINDLLQLSRVTRKSQPFVEVDVDMLVRNVLEDLESRISETGAKVQMTQLPTLQADATQIRQLFQNLIGNALKYHRPDVPPVVDVRAKPPAADREEWHFEIRDNGLGFEAKYSEVIFQPFKRLFGRDQFEGTGMGLAICRKIVERHKGTIRADGTPGEGATFVFTLPEKQATGAISDGESM